MPLSRLAQQIALRIIDYILLNKLECDSHLPEQHLADLFRVSRWPVRSALKFLEEMRIVRSERNRGFFLVKGWAELKGTALNAAMPEEEDETYFAIAEAKLVGELPEQFSENELMRRYRLSRVRALRILHRMAQEGWVERLPGHGWAFLPIITSPEAYDLGYRFRVTLEPNAVMEATFRVDTSAFVRAREQQRALLDGDLLRLSRAQLFQINSQFHETIVGWANNPFYLDALKRINRVRRLIEYHITVDRSRLALQCSEHLEFLDRLEGGDRTEAAEFLRSHIEKARRIKTGALA
jgi:DNA-binding GntR family transcriptional regulator